MSKNYQMDGTNGLKETAGLTAPVASSTLSVNVFTAQGKAMVGERPKPFCEAPGFDLITSTLIFVEHDAVLAALINYAFLAHSVTDEAVKATEQGGHNQKGHNIRTR